MHASINSVTCTCKVCSELVAETDVDIVGSAVVGEVVGDTVGSALVEP